MALAQVSKINIVGHQKNQKEFLEVLQNAGFVQFEEQVESDLEKQNLNEELSKIEYKTAGVKFCLDFLANHETEKKSLKEKIDSKINLTLVEIEKKVKELDLEGKIKEIQEIEAGINEANSIKEKINLELSEITPWNKLDFIPNHEKMISGFDFKLLMINENLYQDFLNRLQKDLPLTEVEKIKIEKKEIFAVLFYKTNDESKISEIINELSIKISEIPDLKISISDRIKKINQEIEQSESRIEKLTKEAQRLALNQTDLKIAFDYLNWQKEFIFNQQKSLQTKQTFSLIGWIDKSKIKNLEKEFSKISDEFVIDEIKIKEEENVPIIFKNSWAQPFEFVTNVYGAPQYNEPDPTPWLAPFFIFFFGLCLTDAGYGIILALTSFIALKLFKPAKEAAKMFKVLMYGGIVTFFAGAAVGGWFGIVIDDIKIEWLKNILTTIRMIDPVKDPLTMLVFSLILGIIQVLVGIIVSFWWKLKNKDIKSAILDDVVWFYFIVVMLVWGISNMGIIDFTASKYLVWLGVAALILTQGRNKKNPVMKIIGGVISLYGLIGYLSDVLSYSRLLALGLATGIIAMVINLIAGLVIEMVPYLGYVIALGILIGGHIFNIGINALGAFIHSSRLQFVEFFPKFMEGGGVLFSPFQRESKYVRIINKDNK